MKKFVWPILVLVFLVTSVFSLRSCYRQKKQSESEIASLKKYLQPAPLKPVAIEKDNAGNKHYFFEPPVVAPKSSLLQSGFIPKKLADSLQKIINAKDKEIKSVTLAKIKIAAQLKSVLKTDTSGKPFYYAKDSVFEVTTYPDSDLVKVTASVGITGIIYVKKPLFKKPTVRAELFANDKRVEFSDVYIVTKPYDDGKKKGLLPGILAIGLLATSYFIFK
nr:hypothetical protein [uncultured Pedobacter sp.]